MFRYRDRDVEDEAKELVKEVLGRIELSLKPTHFGRDKIITQTNQVGGGREGGSPVAQYHNGHLVNRVDFTTGHR